MRAHNANRIKTLSLFRVFVWRDHNRRLRVLRYYTSVRRKRGNAQLAFLSSRHRIPKKRAVYQLRSKHFRVDKPIAL